MTYSSRKPRHGFTLVELLVVIAIIGILIALLLPAVQAAREAARRIQCTNHAKQLSLACNSYAATHNAFPIGAYCQDNSIAPNASIYRPWTWLMGIMPFIENSGISDGIDYSLPNMHDWGPSDPRLAPLFEMSVPTFLCPSDTAEPVPQYGRTNYAGCFTVDDNMVDRDTGFVAGDLRGEDIRPGPAQYFKTAFNFNNPRKLSDVTDGTSNTVCISEIIAPPQDDEWEARAIWGYEWGAAYSAMYGPNTVNYDLDCAGYCNDNFPDAPCIKFGINTWGFIAFARSRHPGGVNAARADGSVSFYNDSIDEDVWSALGTIAGSEIIASDQLD